MLLFGQFFYGSSIACSSIRLSFPLSLCFFPPGQSPHHTRNNLTSKLFSLFSPNKYFLWSRTEFISKLFFSFFFFFSWPSPHYTINIFLSEFSSFLDRMNVFVRQDGVYLEHVELGDRLRSVDPWIHTGRPTYLPGNR